MTSVDERTATQVASRQVPPPRSKSWRARLREPAVGLIFILPMLVLFVIFRYVPTLGAGAMSLTNYRLSGEYTFVGLENFQRLLTDDIFLSALRTTLIYAVIYVPLVFFIAMGTALLLNHVIWAKGFFRGALFLPYVTSFVLAGIIWSWVYAFDGLINGMLARVGVDPIPFLTGDQLLILGSIGVVSAWRGFGYSMLILLAGLKNVPQELTEAATLDGANAVQRFRRITFPLLRPVVFFVLVIETIAAFQVFDVIYVMTGGGPARASYTIIYMLYEQGFKFFDFGYAATIGIALFVIVFVISLIQRRFLDREIT